MTVSFLGDGLYTVAIAWQVYALSNVPTALAVVGVAWMVPQVLLLLDRRRDQRPLRAPARAHALGRDPRRRDRGDRRARR